MLRLLLNTQLYIDYKHDKYDPYVYSELTDGTVLKINPAYKFFRLRIETINPTIQIDNLQGFPKENE